MEIEAKFTIPNRQVYRDFLRLRSLAGFTLTPAGAVKVTDHYVDTADAHLLNAGYACRLRTDGASVLVSLKGLGGATGAIHHRDEQEVQLPDFTLDVQAWPPGPARDLALALTDGAPLQPLFDLEQHRVRADVMVPAADAPRRIAQLSLDEVRAAVGRRPAFYYELEVELTDEGTEADLTLIAGELTSAYHLTPEPRSKFERGLATLRHRGSAVEGQLSPAERTALRDRAQHPDSEEARRAAVILGWSEGLPTREIVARSGLSAGRVRFWLRAFRERRMAVFEDDEGRKTKDEGERAPQVSAAQTGVAGEPAVKPKGRRVTRAPQPKRGPGDPASAVEARALEPQVAAPLAADEDRPTDGERVRRRGLPTVLDFCRQHRVDLTHARCVAGHADKLFILLRPIHDLPRKRRGLLHQAALLSAVGMDTDPERPHRASRDLILGQPLHDVATGDRLILACVVSFQRGKVQPEKEPAMAALEPKQRDQVLALAALLRLAEALDFSRSGATVIIAAEGVHTACCEITLSGPSAEVDARQATERSRLWSQLFEQELVFTGDGGRETTAQERMTEDKRPVEPAALSSETAGQPAGVAPASETSASATWEPPQPDQPMSEAGRKIMRLHLGRMLANEAGTRAGEDIEALHDMRVATRRIRAAYGIFAEYFDEETIKPFLKGLRRTGRTLGAVRDLDVLIEKAKAYQAGLPPEATDPAATGVRSDDIGPLLDHWQARRTVARRQMLDYLDRQSYRNFVAAFTTFLDTPGAGALTLAADQPVPYQVRHVVPRLIFTRYEAVRAYEPVMAHAPLPTYHLLRIDCKRLRYALEFFREVLGPEAPEIIKQVTAMQDLLGALQDAHVAEGLIEEFLHSRPKVKKKTAVPLPGVELYLAAQRAVQQDLLAQFPAPWAQLTGPEFRRSLALAVAAL